MMIKSTISVDSDTLLEVKTIKGASSPNKIRKSVRDNLQQEDLVID